MELKSKLVIEMGRGKCSQGKVWRKPYRRDSYVRDGVRVKAATVTGGCIVDRGAPGKTPKEKRWAKFPKKGEHFLPGWSKRIPAERRRMALTTLAKRVGCRDVWGKLHQLANVTTDKPTERVAIADREWIRRQGWCPWKTPAGK
jgi:hypothetical protein